ncbi:hypothetical protein ACJW31_07G141700 [Castanea mollissima]
MAKLALVLLLFSLGMAMQLVQSIKEDPEESRLNFYFHDTLSGKNPSAVEVAEASITKKSPTLFGLLNIFDDPLTEGPEPTSKRVGRGQGLYGSAGQQEVDLLMAMNLVFTTGKFNGRSITILGRNAVLHPIREMPIIGGTETPIVGGIGLFRIARGYAIAQMHWFDLTTGDAIVGYNVTVVHQG